MFSRIKGQSQRLPFFAPRLLVLAFALCSALLNCCLIPLWEGFYEPFHYGYVQNLSTHYQFPVLKKTMVSEEIYRTFEGQPVSFILKRAVAGLISFEDWFSFTPEERVRREQIMASISPSLRFQPSILINYEAQQAPLAYLLLAPVNGLLSTIHLPARVLILRVIVALIATVLMFFACEALCRELGFSQSFRIAALFCIFATQIVYSAISHVANDWLSVSLGAWFFVFLVCFAKNGTRRNGLALALITGLGLLAKAYFMAFVPVLIAVLAWQLVRARTSWRTGGVSVLALMALATPWYVRNLLLYRNVSGMQESVKGAKTFQVLDAARQIYWPRSLIQSARWSLWTGNGCHFSFSQRTLNVELVLISLALVLLFVHWRKTIGVEAWILIGIGAFIAALLYDLCLTWVDTHGLQTTTGPYYSPVILPAIFILGFLGLQRSGMVGRVIATCLCVLCAWIAFLTYAFKLAPSYGGKWGRASLSSVIPWWRGHPLADLQGVTLAPPTVVIVFLVCFLLLLGANLGAVLTLQYRRNR